MAKYVLTMQVKSGLSDGTTIYGMTITDPTTGRSTAVLPYSQSFARGTTSSYSITVHDTFSKTLQEKFDDGYA